MSYIAIITKSPQPQFKQGWLTDAIGKGLGGIVSGIGSVVGSIAGGNSASNAQKSANETNMQIAQMNNEFNERMLEKQIAYNRENQQVQNQWSENMYNKYNSPQAQVSQLQKAGINPYTQGTSPIGSNQTSAQAGAINPPTATPVQVHPVTGMADAIQNASSMLLQLPLLVAETEGKKLDNVGKTIDNDFKVALTQAKLDNLVHSTNNLKLKNTFQDLSNQMFQRTFDMEVDRKAMQNQLLDIQIQDAAAKLIQDNVLAKYAEKEKLQELKLRSAEITSELAKGKLTYQQFKTEVEKTKGLIYENQYKQAYEKYMMWTVYGQAIKLKQENETYKEFGTYDATVTHEDINELGGSVNGGLNVGAGGVGAGINAGGHGSRKTRTTYKTKMKHH